MAKNVEYFLVHLFTICRVFFFFLKRVLCIPVYVVQELKTRGSWILDKHSTNWVASQLPICTSFELISPFIDQITCSFDM